MLAIGVTGALANLPCGAWRVHTRKFSPGWFLAVHATIPFIAILRKAVVMPRWAIALTVAAAVVGQFAGARLERRRLACVAHERAAWRRHGLPSGRGRGRAAGAAAAGGGAVAAGRRPGHGGVATRPCTLRACSFAPI